MTSRNIVDQFTW